MLYDVLTVMWKEWKEILTMQRGNTRMGWLNQLLIVGVFGVFLPLQSGRAWVQSPVMLIYWTWVPLFLVTTVIADSFAGERERHTLETLLASRLPDQAILLGKVAAAVSYACAITWISLLVGLVVVNIAYGAGQLLLFTPLTLVAGLVLTVLGGGLSANAGVLVSLRAQTARQAAQTMSLFILALVFVPIIGLQLLPASARAGLLNALSTAGAGGLFLIVLVLLVALDGVLFVLAMARFQRAKLILD
jgi:ABC-2 type transport system permease protein